MQPVYPDRDVALARLREAATLLPRYADAINRLYDQSERLANDTIHPAHDTVAMLRITVETMSYTLEKAWNEYKATGFLGDKLKDQYNFGLALFLGRMDVLPYALEATDKLLSLYQHEEA